MSFLPKPHEIYKHFKGNLYQITAIAEHTETGESLVVYQAMYGDFKTYARPLAMFTDRVDREKYPEVRQEFRFELQGPEAARQREETEPEKTGSGAVGREREETGSGAVDREREETGSGAVGREREETGSGAVDRETGRRTQAEAELTEGERALDPMVLQFLDADSYEEKLNILAWLRHKITDEMITTMAIACDVEIGDGDTQERYEALKACLVTLERYECQRIR